MAATVIGFRDCPFCDHKHAHIKQSDGKNPYMHCPGCGIVTTARSGDQARYLMCGMRKPGESTPAGAAAHGPQPPATDDPIIVKGGAAPAQPEAKAPAAPPRRAGLWDQLMGGKQ